MADEPKMVTILDGLIKYEEQVPDLRTKAVTEAIEAGLTKFETHKEALLANLHDAYQHGPKSEPFDADKSWRDLTHLAGTYFWEASVKQKQVAMPAADRRKRLRELAKALGQARGVADRAMQDDVGDDLFSAWVDGTHEHEPLARIVPNDDGSFALVRLEDEFKKVMAGIAALETAALRAADEVRTRPGRPKGTTVLPRGYIEVLASVYQNNASEKPGAGVGPFARFVSGFLTALGRSYITDESVIDAIKDARALALARSNPKWGPLPFDEGP
jgi:hypothetical protein